MDKQKVIPRAGRHRHGWAVLAVARRHRHPISGKRAVQLLHLAILVSGCPIYATKSSPGAQQWDREASALWLCTLRAIRLDKVLGFPRVLWLAIPFQNLAMSARSRGSTSICSTALSIVSEFLTIPLGRSNDILLNSPARWS